MTDELVFYTHPMSRGRIVRWMLEEVGQPYRTEILDYGTTMKGPEYLAINPMGKVPALRHGETVVTETAAICAYLADAFPEAGLAPPHESQLRGPYYRWLFFAAGPLEAAITNKMLGFEIPAERQAMAGYGSYPAVLDALEQARLRAQVPCRREFHSGGRVCRLTSGLGHDVRLHREAPGVRALSRGVRQPPSRGARARDR
jgi:glutathione S-transferase